MDEVAGQISDSDCALFIATNKNVGIGTTDPDTVLHVRGQDNQFRLQTTRSSGSHLNWSPSGGAGSDWDLRYSSNGSSAGDRLWFFYGGDQRFYTGGGVDRMIITSSGNVGIGTPTPGYTLEIVGSDTTGTQYGTESMHTGRSYIYSNHNNKTTVSAKFTIGI